jgi:hypothetical protein
MMGSVAWPRWAEASDARATIHDRRDSQVTSSATVSGLRAAIGSASAPRPRVVANSEEGRFAKLATRRGSLPCPAMAPGQHQ